MYDADRLEFNMSALAKKTVASHADATSNGSDRRYPAEAYMYDDDVTPEAVDDLRKKASKVIGAEEWEVVDGFGAEFESA